VTARRFGELGVVSEQLDTPEQVERSPRTVQSVELLASANDSLVALNPGRRAPQVRDAPDPGGDRVDHDHNDADRDWVWVAETLNGGGREKQEGSGVRGGGPRPGPAAVSSMCRGMTTPCCPIGQGSRGGLRCRARSGWPPSACSLTSSGSTGSASCSRSAISSVACWQWW